MSFQRALVRYLGWMLLAMVVTVAAALIVGNDEWPKSAFDYANGILAARYFLFRERIAP